MSFYIFFAIINLISMIIEALKLNYDIMGVNGFCLMIAIVLICIRSAYQKGDK